MPKSGFLFILRGQRTRAARGRERREEEGRSIATHLRPHPSDPRLPFTGDESSGLTPPPRRSRTNRINRSPTRAPPSVDAHSKPCRQWNGWCDNNNQNVSHSADDRTRDFTGPFSRYNVDLNNLRELISTIRNAVRVVVIHSLIGIVICVLLVIHLLYR